jgi:hypothetical protein
MADMSVKHNKSWICCGEIDDTRYRRGTAITEDYCNIYDHSTPHITLKPETNLWWKNKATDLSLGSS